MAQKDRFYSPIASSAAPTSRIPRHISAAILMKGSSVRQRISFSVFPVFVPSLSW